MKTKEPLEDYLSKKRMEIANRFITDDDKLEKILDIGCGEHPLFLYSIDFKEKFGIDRLNIKDKKGINFKRLDISKGILPYRDNTFNIITCLAVIEHINLVSGKKLIKEVYRILKPFGKFIITTPTIRGNNLLKYLSKIGLINKEKLSEHTKIYSLEELRVLLMLYNFNILGMGLFELKLNNYICVQK